MDSLKEANQKLSAFQKIVNQGVACPFTEETGFKVGVDLGTSSIVFVVLDQQNQPIFGAFEEADVIKDGLVVNYHEALAIVKRLKEQAEATLAVPITHACGAIPPGTVGNNKRVVGNILEGAGLIVDQLVDEPSAAALLLHVVDGGVIDVGGGTTGISIFQNGEAIYVADEPTGGTHMTLVLAGYFKLSIEEAEIRKRNPEFAQENFMICRPVVQRMAEISRKIIEKYPTDPLYIVGGAAHFDEVEQEFSNYLQQPVLKPNYPQFVTPLGIAMACTAVSEV